MVTDSTTINYANARSQISKINQVDSVRPLQLGVLDNGLITPGKTVVEVIDETLKSASLADSLGYSRYWLTEHHESRFAWASPEIILTLIAGLTDRINVGTAGILLYMYSPLKIAEVFRLLEVLHPGRVDLGIAGGLPAEEKTRQALAPGFDLKQAVKSDQYRQKLDALIDYLTANPSQKDSLAIEVPPIITETPEMWLLGTGSRNMQLAAARGTAFCYSLFHDCSKRNLNILQEYRSRFQSNKMLKKPKCSLAVGVICAETEFEARQQQTLVEKSFQVNVVGNPEQCKEQLLEIQHRYQVPEIVVISMWHIFEQRKYSYQILAEIFDLSLASHAK